MVIAASVPYQGISGVTPTEGVPNDTLQVRSNPNEFGAQIGAATEKVGGEAEHAANQWNGLIAETQANQNEVAYIKAQGDLKAKYSQYEGLQADQMRPKYEAESQALQEQFRSNLSPIAGKLYDNTTRRYLANDINSYSGYAASQVKQANLNSHKAIIDQTTGMASDPARVTDPTKFGGDLGVLQHSANAQAELNGLTATATGFDKDTQRYTFPDTPEGKNQEASYNQMLDSSKTPYVEQAVHTIASTPGLGPIAAANFVDQNKNIMPPMALAKVQQYLAPKMVNQNIDGAIAQQNTHVEAGWQQNILARTPGAQPDVLGVIRANEGTGYSKDNKGEVVNGINSEAFPKEFAEAKNILDTQGQSAANKYSDAFYQKNIIDKNNIRSLPINTQAIVADAFVNQGGFGDKVLNAAKNGASPQSLIDMRRQEYQRLATNDPSTYGSSLKGWNNRLDNLQQQNIGTFANRAEYLESIKDDYVVQSVDRAGYPDNLAVQQTAEKRARLEINSQIATAKQNLKNDTDVVEKAISGSMTNGKVPMTRQELAAIPGVQPVLDRIQQEQGDFNKSIENRIAKASHGDLSTNSPNAYDAALVALDNTDKYDRQQKIEYLGKGLGSDNPSYSISQKDFNDFKPAIDLNNDVKSKISDHMKAIASANGNLDGKGQQRAVQWYNSVMSAYKNKGENMSDSDFADNIKPPAQLMPSRIQQLQSIAAEKAKNPPPVVTTREQRDALPSGATYIRDGKQYTKQ